MDFLDKHNIKTKTQLGFVSNKSTFVTIFDVTTLKAMIWTGEINI